jgi:predicted alpha/beta-hydrolase family hydrolase
VPVSLIHSPMARPQAVTISVDGARTVSGLLQAPHGARVCYVLAHGAGAGMSHPFMAAAANGLAERGIATLRYQFPYMEQGSKRRMRRNLPRQPSARQSLKHPVSFQGLPWSQAANRLEAA